MGGSVSNFPDNQALIDSLKDSCELSTDSERVLRLVDRGCYAIEPKEQIYCDSPWRVDKLHLSAPGIYATVLRELDIKPGQSVLNIGSGTGYLSTLFGLILGSNSVNHGIELHESNVAFARDCLDKFLTTDAIYERNFCKPHFTVGNIFTVVPPSAPSIQVINDSLSEPTEDFDLEGSSPDDLTQHSPLAQVTIKPPPFVKRESSVDGEFEIEFWPTYDRIYVGCMLSSVAQLEAILRLLNVGGRLISPIYDQLHQIDRISDNTVKDTVLSSVSFVNLVPPSEDDPHVTPPPRRMVERLEHLACRQVRQQLREVILQRAGSLPTLGRFVRVRRSSTVPQQPGDSENHVTEAFSAKTSTSSSSSLLPSSPDSSTPSQSQMPQQDVPVLPFSSPSIFVNITPHGHGNEVVEGDSRTGTIRECRHSLGSMSINVLHRGMRQSVNRHDVGDEGATEEGPVNELAESDEPSADQYSDFTSLQWGLYEATWREQGGPCEATWRRLKTKRRRREGEETEEVNDSETEHSDRNEEEHPGERRRGGRRMCEMTWKPQSYMFLEKMQQLIEEELSLSSYISDLVLRAL